VYSLVLVIPTVCLVQCVGALASVLAVLQSTHVFAMTEQTQCLCVAAHALGAAVAGDVHRATVRRVLASAEQLASTLLADGAAGSSAAGGDTDDGDIDSGADDDVDGDASAEAVASGSALANGYDEEDAAILIALAFPDRIAQRRSRSNRCRGFCSSGKYSFHNPENCPCPALPLT
jgi:hypothetical protein